MMNEDNLRAALTNVPPKALSSSLAVLIQKVGLDQEPDIVLSKPP
jgi:hypothetical protein